MNHETRIHTTGSTTYTVKGGINETFTLTSCKDCKKAIRYIKKMATGRNVQAVMNAIIELKNIIVYFDDMENTDNNETATETTTETATETATETTTETATETTTETTTETATETATETTTETATETTTETATKTATETTTKTTKSATTKTNTEATSIHYRLLNSDLSPASDTVFRSLERARKEAQDNVNIWAFNSRANAVKLSKQRLHVTESAPALITETNIQAFIQHHKNAKAVPAKYPPHKAELRRKLEARFNHTLFGFDEQGRAINARQNMDVSCNWVYYSCPIEINGKRSNIRGLESA